MKKLLCAVLVLTMIVMSSVAVFAASPEYATLVADNTTATTADGAPLEIEVKPVEVTPEVKESIETVIQAIEPAAFAEVAPELDVATVVLLVVVDVKPVAKPEGGFTVKINTPGITSGSKVFVLHDKADNNFKDPSTVEVLKATVIDGAVIIYTDSASPFAVIVDKETAKAVEAVYVASSGEVSPDTFDYGFAALVTVLGLMTVAAGAVVLVRSKAN